MRYKFLMHLYKYKCKLCVLPIEECGKVDRDVIYNNLIELYYLFKKSLPESTDTSIVNKLIDFVVLGNRLDDSIDINKQYKFLIKFIDNMSIDDFRILHAFRYFFLHYFKDVSITLYKTNHPDAIHRIIYLNRILIACITIEGGILYNAIQIKDAKINIGRCLDDLFNVDHVEYNHLTGLGFAFPKDFKESLYPRTFKLPVGFISLFDGEYSKYLNLCNMYYNPAYKFLILKYVNIKCLKMSLADKIDSFCTSVNYESSTISSDIVNSMFLMDHSYCNSFYSRKLLLPAGGVKTSYIKDKINFLTVVNESYDPLLGYTIGAIDVNKKVNSSYYDCSFSTVYLQPEITDIHKICRMPYILYSLYSLEGGKYDLINLEMCSSCFKPSDKRLQFDLTNLQKYEFLRTTTDKEYKRYENSGYKSYDVESKSSVDKVEKIVKVDAFTRKLPKGFHRSQSASELAKKYCINLEDNETIVDNFERVQKVNRK